MDGAAFARAIEDGASDQELVDLREEMSMTRFATDEAEQREFLGAFRASGVTGTFQNTGEEGNDPLRLLKRLSRFTYSTDLLRDRLSKAIRPEEILDNATGRTLANLRTELSTTRMAFQRVVHLEKAKKAGITQFLYVGPDDEVTRDYSAERVDRVFTLEEIQAMDNGQGLPVEVYGGGWNCRHHWRPVSDDLADELRAEGEQWDSEDE